MQVVAELRERFAEVRERVADAAVRSGRRPEEVLLVAVSKYADPEQVRGLIDLGHRDFGENKIQQMEQRAAMVGEYLDRLRVLPETRKGDGSTPPDAVRWHMIGHLQRNKAKKCCELARLIHTVDSLRLAEELQGLAVKRDADIEVLVQVNIAEEEQKHGVPSPAARALCEQIDSMAHVHVRGLMCMAPYSDEPEHSRPVFARCRELFEDLRRVGVGEGRMNILSMGMSGDYAVAIEEGSNCVRVGSSIFGERPKDFDDSADG
ncbi:MAG: YggS family pyridoxal phosphate-dependent enzyme [Planctomycetota bacterium]